MLCIVLLFFGFAVINPIFNKKTYKIYLLLFAVALACLAWFTKPDYTMDLYRAYGQLDLFRQISFGKAYSYYGASTPLTLVYYYALARICPENGLLPALTVFIVYGFSFALLYKAAMRFDSTKKKDDMALLFFMANFNYFYVIGNTRIYICFAVLAYFMYVDIVEKKYRIFCFLVYAALCYFHYGILPFVLIRIVLLLIKKTSPIVKKAFIVILPVLIFAANKIAIALGSASDGLLGTVEKKVSGYSDYEVFGIWQFSMSIIRLVLALLIMLLSMTITESLFKKKNTDGLLGNRLLNGMYNYDWMIVYSIVAIFLFASNYQFVLRTPNFIQIALSVPLLFLLYRFRNPVNKNLKPYTYILLSAESVIHFAYLLLYVYNNAQFVF